MNIKIPFFHKNFFLPTAKLQKSRTTKHLEYLKLIARIQDIFSSYLLKEKNNNKIYDKSQGLKTCF